LLEAFDPATGDLDEWAKKMKRVFSIWPKIAAPQFAVRLSFLLTGTAYDKAQLIDIEELATDDQKGLERLVLAIGGNWASTEEEKLIDLFEKAVYNTKQQSDEQNRSYADRSDVAWAKLLSKGATLQQLQAFITLRHSSLSREDKKRIIYDVRGSLDMDKLRELMKGINVKMGDLTKDQGRLKVYPTNFTEAEVDPSAAPSGQAGWYAYETGYAAESAGEESDVDDECVQAFVAEGNADAILVADFEKELTEFFQDTPELHNAFIAYQDARKKLLEARKSRGFWPQGGGKPSGFGGGSKAKEKGRGRAKREKDFWRGSPTPTAGSVAKRATGRRNAQKGRMLAKPASHGLPTPSTT
jgi:hypothetical protein